MQTGAPVYVRNEPVGSTCTIITNMFFERGVMPSKKLAGLLAAAIVSDTIMFKSPTSTAVDRAMAERMAKIAGLSLEALGREIFSISAAGNHKLDDLYFADFKQFQFSGHTLGISQITSADSEEFLSKKDGFLSLMQKELDNRGYDMMLLMLTDVLKEGTLLLAVGDVESVRARVQRLLQKQHRVPARRDFPEEKNRTGAFPALGLIAFRIRSCKRRRARPEPGKEVFCMHLKIDGHSVDAQCGESLLDLVKKLGLDSTDFAYAAARGKHCRGNVYAQLCSRARTGDEVRPAPRRSGAPSAQATAKSPAQVRQRARQPRVRAHHAVCVSARHAQALPQNTGFASTYALSGAGLYTNVGDNMCLRPAVEGIKQEMRAIVSADLTLERKREDIDDAIDFFSAAGKEDKVRLRQWRQFSYFDVYRQEDYVDYFYGEMAPSTGYASVFDLQALPTGLFLIRPSSENPNKPAKHVFLPHLTSVFSESEEWGRLMHCAVVADLNDMVAQRRNSAT